MKKKQRDQAFLAKIKTLTFGIGAKAQKHKTEIIKCDNCHGTWEAMVMGEKKAEHGTFKWGFARPLTAPHSNN